jgi:hypothetical protein
VAGHEDGENFDAVIATDQHRSYARHIRAYFGFEGISHGTETKVFGDGNRGSVHQFRFRHTRGFDCPGWELSRSTS